MLVKLHTLRVFLLLVAHSSAFFVLLFDPPPDRWAIPFIYLLAILFALLVTTAICVMSRTTIDKTGIEQTILGVIVRRVYWSRFKSRNNLIALVLKGDFFDQFILWPKPWLIANQTEIRQELEGLNIPGPIRNQLL